MAMMIYMHVVTLCQHLVFDYKWCKRIRYTLVEDWTITLFIYVYQLDDWVLCRIYKKKNLTRPPEQRVEDSFAQIVTTATDVTEPQTHKFPRTCSLTHLWEFDYMASISQLLDENAYNVLCNNQETIGENGTEKYQQAEQAQQLLYTDGMKFQMNNQPIFVNPVSELQ